MSNYKRKYCDKCGNNHPYFMGQEVSNIIFCIVAATTLCTIVILTLIG